MKTKTKKTKTTKPTRLYTYNVGIYNKETGEKIGWHSCYNQRRDAFRRLYELQHEAEYMGGHYLVEEFTEDVPATLGFFGKIRKFFTGVHPTTPVEMKVCTAIEYKMACWTVDANYAAYLMRTHLCHKNVKARSMPMTILEQAEIDDLPF